MEAACRSRALGTKSASRLKAVRRFEHSPVAELAAVSPGGFRILRSPSYREETSLIPMTTKPSPLDVGPDPSLAGLAE